MLWKAGCVALLAGVLLSVGSCFFLGTAVQRAAAERQVANLGVPTGAAAELSGISIDPAAAVEIEIRAQLEIGKSLLDAERSRAQIVDFRVPVNYEIRDAAGRVVHLGAGTMDGSTIVPEPTSPHFDSFDPVVSCSHRSLGFEPPASGTIGVRVEIPAHDDDGNAIHQGRVLVFDRLPSTAGRWAVGGLLSLIVGPLIVAGGAILFLLGLIVNRSRTRATARGTH